MPTRSVPKGAPIGRPERAELFIAQNTGVPTVTLRSAPWGRAKGDILVRLGWENSVNMPSSLVNISTEHSQCTLLFQTKKIGDF